MRSKATAYVALLLAGAVLGAPSADAKEPRKLTGKYKQLDYERVRAAVPEMKRLSEEGAKRGKRLHWLVERLRKAEETGDEPEMARLRTEVREILVEYRDNKIAMVKATKDVLELKRSGLTDQEVFDRLHETMLRGIHWKGRSFKKCIRDISRAIGVPMRTQYSVVEMNTVDCEYREMPAESILAWLCNGFDLQYVIYDGEMVLYKRITPNEERFINYQKKHPEAKLRYWDKTDASGALKEGKK